MMKRKGVGPASEVREHARRRFLDGVQQRISSREKLFEELNVYLVFVNYLSQVVGALGPAAGQPIIALDIPPKLDHLKVPLRQFIFEILMRMEQFKRSDEEGMALLARLLVWSASKLAEPRLATLEKQQSEKPLLIYGTRSPTDEIPFESL